MDALNGGLGNYSGASLTIARNGGANGHDAFGFTSDHFTVSGSNLQVAGQTFATFSQSGGTLSIHFTSSESTATSTLVNAVLQGITYTNGSAQPGTSATLDWTFNDGSSDSTGTNQTSVSLTDLTAASSTGAAFDTTSGTNLTPGIIFDSGDETLTINDASHVVGSTINGGDGYDDLRLYDDGADLSKAAGLTGFETLSLGYDVSVTMTVEQFNSFQGFGGVVGVGQNTIILADSGTFTRRNGAEIIATASDGNAETITLSHYRANGATLIAGDPNLDHFVVTGSTGAQIINGSAGADTIDGGAGMDTIRGGDGADALTGGADDDIFQGSVSELNGDSITDLSVGDQILLTDITALTTSNIRLHGNFLEIDTDDTTFDSVEISLNLGSDKSRLLGIGNISSGSKGTLINIGSANNPPPVVNLSGDASSGDFLTDFRENGSSVNIYRWYTDYTDSKAGGQPPEYDIYIGAKIADSDMYVMDSEGDRISSITIRLTNDLDGDKEGLNVSSSAQYDLKGVTNADDIFLQDTIHITGIHASLAEVETFLKEVTYANNADVATPAQRIITVVINDGLADSATVTSRINVDDHTAFSVAVFSTITGENLSPWSRFGESDDRLIIDDKEHVMGAIIDGLGGTDELTLNDDGTDLSNAATFANFEVLSLGNNVSASMTEAQCNGFTHINGAGTNQITITDASSGLSGHANVENYILEAASTFTLGAEGQNVTGSSSNDTIVVSALALTGSINGGAGNDTLSLTDGANISAATIGNFQNLALANGASVTMSAEQLNAFTGTISGSGKEAITIVGSGSLTGTNLGAIETIASASGGNSETISLSAASANGKTLIAGDASLDQFVISASAGDHTLNASAGADVFQGSVANLNGDSITDLAVGDKILLQGVNGLNTSNVRIKDSSLEIDTDATDFASPEASINLSWEQGQALGISNISVANEGNDTVISFNEAPTVVNTTPSSTSTPTPVTQTQVINGATVVTETAQDEQGGRVQTIRINPVSSSANGSSTPASTDVPLHFGGDGSTVVTQISLPMGLGLSAHSHDSADQQSQAASLISLIGGTATGGQGQQDMENFGNSFLNSGIATNLQVNDVVITGSNTSSSTPIRLTGSTDQSFQEAVVIDMRHLTGGSYLELNDIEFATLSGSATVRGGAGENYVFGDDQSQNIVLGAEDDELHGGGGDDIIGSKGGNDNLFGDSGNDTVVGGIGNDTLSGGTGDDVLQGAQQDDGVLTFSLSTAGEITTHYTAHDADLSDGSLDTITFSGDWYSQASYIMDGKVQALLTTEDNRDHFEHYGMLLQANDHYAFLAVDGTRLKTLAILQKVFHGELYTVDALNEAATSDKTLTEFAGEALQQWRSEQNFQDGSTSEEQVVALLKTFWLSLSITQDDIDTGIAMVAQDGGWEQLLLDTLVSYKSNYLLHNGHGPMLLTQSQDIANTGLSQDVGNDALLAGSGNDTLVGGHGSDLLDGGEGTDIAIQARNADAYQIRLNGDGQITLRYQDGVYLEQDTLVDIEQVNFSDRSQDFSASNLDSDTLSQLGALGKLMVGTAPELEQLNAYQGGVLNLEQMAAQLMTTETYQTSQWSAMDDTQFITTLAAEVINEPFSQTDIDYWTGRLDSDLSRADVFVIASGVTDYQHQALQDGLILM